MNIPFILLPKMGLYDIKLYGTNVKVRVVDDLSVMEMGINEFVSEISHPPGLVAADLKGFDELNDSQLSAGPKLLLLCAKDRCLIIHISASLFTFTYFVRHLSYLGKYFFVWTEIDSKILALKKYGRKTSSIKIHSELELVMRMRAGIGDLAARVCKKAELRQFDGLRDLGRKVGVDFPKEGANQFVPAWPPKHGTTIFTDAEVKYAIRDAYMCYPIADKCLKLLPA